MLWKRPRFQTSNGLKCRLVNSSWKTLTPTYLKIVCYFRRWSWWDGYHRTISNSRILEHTDKEVTFSYKDYSDGDKRKEMTLANYEFTRRFMLHILPFRFCKIRHYGIFCNRSLSQYSRGETTFTS